VSVRTVRRVVEEAAVVGVDILVAAPKERAEQGDLGPGDES